MKNKTSKKIIRLFSRGEGGIMEPHFVFDFLSAFGYINRTYT
jgi:hypothetical protein